MSKHADKLKVQVVKCTDCFKSVSVPSRMAIYNFLNGRKDATVTQVVAQIGLSQPTVSYHLNEMKRRGLLKSERAGKEVHYSINIICPHHGQECVLHNLKFPDLVTKAA